MTAGPDIVATTPRLRLREITRQDAAFILELVNQPDWLRHIGDRGVNNLAQAADYIETRMRSAYSSDGYGMYVVENLEDHMAIGLCGLVNRDWLPCPDLGFAILSRFHRRGFAIEASRAAVTLAWERFDLDHLVAVTTLQNTASQQLLGKLGFELRDQKFHTPENEYLYLYSLICDRA
ncbi:GNAT family N-acetyltransferase [Marinihelvus fidelis]|uniref:GNAT family N-acetyltransferase n=1 Tax=Marinihelvus fidelis TaxID=2613842 RepID=UPI00177C617A|nr:GNAT family N-acetyltransferase [Marinihelvus fidelis]